MNETSIYDGTFWDNRFWFPAGVAGWEVFEKISDEGLLVQAKPRDFYSLPLFTLGLFYGRKIFSKYIGVPLGRHCLGIIGNRTKPECNKELENIYLENKRENKGISTIGQDRNVERYVPVGWTNTRTLRWFRRRRNQDRPDRVSKFVESLWRFLFYFSMTCYNFYFFYNADWIQDNSLIWRNYPYIKLDYGAFWFYSLTIGFYGSLLLSVLTDVRRKDFYEMIAHHFLTIILMMGSYMTNLWRVGVLLLMNNDIADWIIEVSKMLIYCRKTTLANITAVIFGVTWIYTRNYRFIAVVLHACLVNPFLLKPREFTMSIDLDGIKPWPLHIILNIFLIILTILQFFWSYLLLIFIKKILTNTDQKVNDDRSDAEEYTDEEEHMHEE